MTTLVVNLHLGITEGQHIAVFHQHIRLEPTIIGRLKILIEFLVPVQVLALVQKGQVLFREIGLTAVLFHQHTGTTEMIPMAVGMEDPLNILRIKAHGTDRFEDLINRLGIRGIQDQQTLTGIKQVDGHILIAYIIQIVCNMKGFAIPHPGRTHNIISSNFQHNITPFTLSR